MELFKLLGIIGIDNSEAISGLDETTAKAKLTSEEMGNRFTAIGNKSIELADRFKWVSAMSGVAFGGAVKYASDMEESINKVDVAFGKNANEVKTWSDSALQNFGIAKGTALDMASTFGDMGTSMGLTTGEASKMSTSLVGLAGDLSSFKNISVDQSMTALNGIFTGETESLKTLGIVMTETNLDAFAMANGFGKTVKEMTEAEKVNLRYQYVLDKTKNAQGDFSRTGDSTANQLRKLKEGVKELATSIGSVALPVVAKIVGIANNGLALITNMPDGAKKLVMVLLGLGTAIAPVLLGFGKFMTLIGNITTNWNTLISGLRTGITFLMANPIILVITAVAVALVMLYRNSEAFRTAVLNLASSIIASVRPALDSFMQVVSAVVPLIQALFSIIGTLAGIIGNVLAPIISALSPIVANVFSKMASVIKGKMTVILGAVKLLTKVATSVNNYLLKPIENASKKIKSAVDKIKKAFSGLKIKLPSFKVPSISVQWKKADSKLLKALGLKGLPSLKVRWNAMGGVFNKPTILDSRAGLQGVGEAGAEAIAPISTLQKYVRQAVGQETIDSKTVMAECLNVMKQIYANLPYLVAEGINGQKIDWNGRELGRFINTYAR